MHSKIELYHNIKNCKNELYTPILHDFLSGKSKCPSCSNKYKRNATKEHINDIKELLKKEQDGIDYEILSKRYVNNSQKLVFFHKKCQKNFKMSKNGFFDNKNRCPFCFKIKQLSIKEINNIMKNEPDYLLLSKTYKNDKTKMLFKHLVCGCSFLMRWNNFYISKNRCPFCSRSKGNTEIFNILSKNNIKFYSEYSFINCRDKRPLPFDFYIPNKNLLIEYDGIQHFEPSKTFGKNNFNIIKAHDEIKTKYAEENNIKLLRIPYYQFKNIEKIVLEALSET